MRWSSVVGVAGLAALIGVSASSSTSAASGGELYVIQGLPGVTADVAVDGKVVQSGVAGAKVVGPIAVDAGSHKITLTSGGDQIASATQTVADGDSVDLVAHLPTDPAGDPVVTAFDNDLSAIPDGKARLAVAHTAAVGPADIRVDGKVLFANVANGETLTLEVPGGTYSVDIVPAGQSSPVVLGPADLEVKAGALNRVFAIGDPSAKEMTVVVQVLSVPGSGSPAPDRVDTGKGGQAAQTRSFAALG